jgi:hypothetical protein
MERSDLSCCPLFTESLRKPTRIFGQDNLSPDQCLKPGLPNTKQEYQPFQQGCLASPYDPALTILPIRVLQSS